jgi:hypothetical protein
MDHRQASLETNNSLLAFVEAVTITIILILPIVVITLVANTWVMGYIYVRENFTI